MEGGPPFNSKSKHSMSKDDEYRSCEERDMTEALTTLRGRIILFSVLRSCILRSIKGEFSEAALVQTQAEARSRLMLENPQLILQNDKTSVVPIDVFEQFVDDPNADRRVCGLYLPHGCTGWKRLWKLPEVEVAFVSFQVSTLLWRYTIFR